MTSARGTRRLIASRRREKLPAGHRHRGPGSTSSLVGAALLIVRAICDHGIRISTACRDGCGNKWVYSVHFENMLRAACMQHGLVAAGTAIKMHVHSSSAAPNLLINLHRQDRSPSFTVTPAIASHTNQVVNIKTYEHLKRLSNSTLNVLSSKTTSGSVVPSPYCRGRADRRGRAVQRMSSSVRRR